ncbi:MAG TPA: hypothetical protein VJX67_19020 [Blastocatellia bacterium]|nr:hypothetical protein [Blastocatellia bacterium]
MRRCALTELLQSERSDELPAGSLPESPALGIEAPDSQRLGSGSGGCKLADIELFDDYGLLDSVATITGKNPEAADELTMYLLLILDGLGDTGSETVRNTLRQSVKIAFQFTNTFEAALELYTLGQRGLVTGPLSPRDIIRGLVVSRGGSQPARG